MSTRLSVHAGAWLMGPLLAMRKALYTTLVNDATLTGLLGGLKIYSSVPNATEPPYVTFGQARMTLWNGGSRTGYKHQCALDIWSLQWGDVEMLMLAERISTIISAGTLVLDGYHLLQCYVEAFTCHPPRKEGWRQGSLELVALTEQGV
jgi:Protein of unknown function (DUF3168)